MMEVAANQRPSDCNDCDEFAGRADFAICND
jgi:hypothetical protein